MKHVLGCLLVALATTGFARADAVTTGGLKWLGKSIHYKATADGAVGVSSGSTNTQCALKISVDGNEQQVLITKKGVEYQDKKIDKKEWKTLEVIVNGDKVEIFFDRKKPAEKLKNPFTNFPTITRAADVFTVSYQDGVKLTITMTGKIDDGKVEPNQIGILAPTVNVTAKSLDKVPEKYRDMIKYLIYKVEEIK